tara:strand:+ start:819 stop:1637 length:819 start_codon:yes stop_codon:yes gene_type:complete
MVTNNTEPEAEPIQAPAPESNEGTEFQPDINPLISEVDRLNGAADVDISEPVPEGTQTDQTTTEEPIIPEPVTAESPATTEEPILPEAQQQQQAQPTPQQLAELQRQATEYEQVRQRAAVQQEYERVQRQLESQGASPEEAQQQASQYMQSRTSQQDLMRQADAYGKELIAKQTVVEHIATQYKLTVADLPLLKQAESPEIMESLAKQIVSRRKEQDELEQFRKAQVPPQQFDNSQGAPEVASSDGNWLDRYNAGDRSPNAVAAAKRTLGIE